MSRPLEASHLHKTDKTATILPLATRTFLCPSLSPLYYLNMVTWGWRSSKTAALLHGRSVLYEPKVTLSEPTEIRITCSRSRSSSPEITELTLLPLQRRLWVKPSWLLLVC